MPSPAALVGGLDRASELGLAGTQSAGLLGTRPALDQASPAKQGTAGRAAARRWGTTPVCISVHSKGRASLPPKVVNEPRRS
eukprot:7070888-Alexandrium_andersonii.AAC.1